jgi:hypothetical protein
MGQVIVNGQTVEPCKKVKLTQHMSKTAIRDLIQQKAKEKLNEQQLPDNQEQH